MADELEKSISNIKRTTSPKLDDLIIGDAVESLSAHVVYKPSVLIPLVKVSTPIVIVFFCALLVISFLQSREDKKDSGPAEMAGETTKQIEPEETFLQSDFVQAEPESETPLIPESEKVDVDRLYADGDIDGLINILEKGKIENKFSAVIYVVRLGDANTLTVLEDLSEQYAGRQDSLFSIAVAALKARLDKQKTLQERQASQAGRIIISGIVEDVNGVPIEGVTVHSDLFYDTPRRLLKVETQTMTDRNGIFSLEVSELSPEKDWNILREIIFEHPDYANSWVDWRKASTASEAIVLMTPANIIAGQVIDKQGNPINDAEVIIYLKRTTRYRGGVDYTDLGASHLVTYTNLNGAFVFDAVFEDATARIDIFKPGYAMYSTKDQTNQEYSVLAGQQDLVFSLRPGGVIIGRLMDGSESYQQSGIAVRARKDDVDLWGVTDDNGEFEIIGLSPGTYTVSVWNETIRQNDANDVLFRPVQGVEISAGSRVLIELIKVSGPPVWIEVIDSQTNQGIRHAILNIASGDQSHQMRVRTDGRGSVKLSLPVGDYKAVVTKGHWRQGEYAEYEQAFSVRPDQENAVLLRVNARPVIYGVLLDTDGLAVEGKIEVDEETGFANEAGEFEIQKPFGQAGEVYLFKATNDRFGLAKVFTWDGTDDINEVEVVLEPMSQISASVIDQDGQPIAGLMWESRFIAEEKRFDITGGRTDGEGEFSFDVPPGLAVEVCLGRQKDSCVTTELIEPGQTVDLSDIVFNLYPVLPEAEDDDGFITEKTFEEEY